ncbi:MAG: prenyltransferase/squalene oxidase repeat-containing protein, partial [Candidatus Hodarchaeales archaeon]
MLSFAKPLKRKKRTFQVILLMILVFIPLSMKSNVVNAYEDHNDQIPNELTEQLSENLKQEIKEDNSLIASNSFDIESLFNFINELYDDENNIFLESIGGYPTSVATYEAISILRYLGLDYYFFGENWQENENDITTKLLVDFKDASESGGYSLTPDLDYPSLDGTFGVVASLWLMNEIPGGAKLKSKTVSLLNFTHKEAFNEVEIAFHEINEDPSIKATFQALTILDLIQKIATNPDYEYDETIAQHVNNTVFEFMTNYSVDIFHFIDSFWENNNSYFNSQTRFQTPITDTWYALQSIKILERFEGLLGISLPRDTDYYQNPIITWIKSLQKETGVTKGGFGLTETATVTETGICYAILNLFNSTDKINHTKTLPFIFSSQFLERENRTYSRTELEQIGGFGPNNSTYSKLTQNKLVNIHSTYYAILTLLLSGDIFNSVEIFLKTDQFQIHESINRTNLIIQGERATIELAFKLYNYSSHGSLNLLSSIDNWNLTHIDYLETNPLFTGKPIAEYEVRLQDDTDADFNWTLGTHIITN